MDYQRAEKCGAESFYQAFGRDFMLTKDLFVRHWKILGRQLMPFYINGKLSFSEQRRERMRRIYRFSRLSLSDKELDLRFDHYLAAFESSWICYPDVIACLKQLDGDRLGIITNGDGRQQRDKLDKLNIANYFSVLAVSGDTPFAKPDPYIFTMACKQAGVAPGRCFYVGDSLETDAVASRNAGMKGIWLNRNNDDRRVPDHLVMINTLLQLPDAIA